MTNFTLHTTENTTGRTKELLEGIRKGYGFVPNALAYMAEAPMTVEAFLALDGLLLKSSLTPAQQQIVMLAVSVENGCEFCKVVHHSLGRIKGANAQTLDEINSCSEITDAKDKMLATFAQIMAKTRGRPSQADTEAFLHAGFTRQHIFETILAVTIMTLMNYSNYLTKPEPNKEFLGML